MIAKQAEADEAEIQKRAEDAARIHLQALKNPPKPFNPREPVSLSNVPTWQEAEAIERERSRLRLEATARERAENAPPKPEADAPFVFDMTAIREWEGPTIAQSTPVEADAPVSMPALEVGQPAPARSPGLRIVPKFNRPAIQWEPDEGEAA